MKKECNRCGRCCSVFPMTKEQIERIIMYLLTDSVALRRLKESPVPYNNENVCAFLRGAKDNTFCGIYPVRPEICVAFGVENPKTAELKCPYGTVSSALTAEEAEELLQVYEVTADQLAYPKEFFIEFIKQAK